MSPSFGADSFLRKRCGLFALQERKERKDRQISGKNAPIPRKSGQPAQFSSFLSESVVEKEYGPDRRKI